MSEDFEELEQIPWAALASNSADPRTRYAAAAVVVVAAVVAIGWFMLSGPEPIATLADPVATPPTVAALPAPTLTTVDDIEVPAVAAYSEADLMLIDVGDEEMLASMHAESLVRDYLTVDGDERLAARVDSLLPGAAERADVASYVEWAKAFSVISPEPGQYRVEVLYRVLVEEAHGFVRQPDGALAVDLAIDIDGSAQLLAPPESVAVPVLRGWEQ